MQQRTLGTLGAVSALSLGGALLIAAIFESAGALLVAVMAGAFACYLAIKGFKRIWRPDGMTVAAVTVIAFAATWAMVGSVAETVAANRRQHKDAIAWACRAIDFTPPSRIVQRAIIHWIAVVSSRQRKHVEPAVTRVRESIRESNGRARLLPSRKSVGCARLGRSLALPNVLRIPARYAGE